MTSSSVPEAVAGGGSLFLGVFLDFLLVFIIVLLSGASSPTQRSAGRRFREPRGRLRRWGRGSRPGGAR